ncbi:hypothetical protein C0Q70_05364 [Pomacea canaliculata]|uniref:Uncharacterized protein n=1 Tax=Pomacea canaliculata TaxID=400727 RepID=A0A2T7PKZ9_POMCA|nr:hypothetical protein C0Q70_05364 [Pomacea canaliculata]
MKLLHLGCINDTRLGCKQAWPCHQRLVEVPRVHEDLTLSPVLECAKVDGLWVNELVALMRSYRQTLNDFVRFSITSHLNVTRGFGEDCTIVIVAGEAQNSCSSSSTEQWTLALTQLGCVALGGVRATFKNSILCHRCHFLLRMHLCHVLRVHLYRESHARMTDTSSSALTPWVLCGGAGPQVVMNLLGRKRLWLLCKGTESDTWCTGGIFEKSCSADSIVRCSWKTRSVLMKSRRQPCASSGQDVTWPRTTSCKPEVP